MSDAQWSFCQKDTDNLRLFSVYPAAGESAEVIDDS